MDEPADHPPQQPIKIDGTGNVVGDHNIVTITYQGRPVAIPSLEAVAAHRAALRELLVRRAENRWGGMATYIQEEGAALPVEASPYDQGRLGAPANLIATLRAADRLLVLGEPGAGKTVALERLAWELCGDPEPLIPVMIPLFRYAGAPLAEWVRPMLKETGHLRLDGICELAAFLNTTPARCVFLFDGLNEVAPPYRDTLVEELARWMVDYRRHGVICTSRSQDELWRRVRDEMRTVVVQPISDAHVEAYLVDHLEERGQVLYRQLDARLRTMARRPLILWLIRMAGERGESIPGNRGELYARFVSQMLRLDTKRRMDAEIPDVMKHRALAELAYDLGCKQRLFCSRETAVDVVAKHLGAERARSVVAACLRHGLLAGEETVWFAPHQTVQEYFAAEALLERWRREQEDGILKRLLRTGACWAGQPRGILKLVGQDWWLETFVQLFGLVEDADNLARAVLRANPWLAWWGAEEGRAVSPGTKEAIAARSVRLLESRSVFERRRAVGVLAEMKNERATTALFRAASDLDPEVSGTALQALSAMGEGVRPLVKAAVHGTDRAQWRSAVRYLMMHPDDPLGGQIPAEAWEQLIGFQMIYVPPGPFWMGSDGAKDDLAGSDEMPQHSVVLPGYWIGRTPVTVTQFRAFVAAEEYQVDSDALRGLDDHPVRYVSWDDAMAYCHWLSKRSGVAVTLPSEAEWEKAARGTDSRRYPWGDAEPDARLCNFNNHEGGTTPVGRYAPQGDSLYGCVDMAGNVWEWTRSLHQGYPYVPGDGREVLEGRGPRVLRGGAFSDCGRGVRCASRYRYAPSSRDDDLGFRVVLSPSL